MEADEFYKGMNASIMLRSKFGRRLVGVRALNNGEVLPMVATVTVGKKPVVKVDKVFTLDDDMELVEVVNEKGQ